MPCAMPGGWRGAWTSCSSPWHTPTSWNPLDVEGILALRSISERCVAHIGDAARILEAQNEILYAEERTA